MNRRIAALTMAAVALLGLTACTGPGSTPPKPSVSTSGEADGSDGDAGDGQSVEEACALIQQTMTEATEEFSNASTEDPAAVVEAMKAAAEKLQDAASQISN